MAARKFAGETEVQFGGEKFKLRLGIREIETLEAELDVGIGEVGKRFARAIATGDVGQARLRDARAVLRQGFAGAKKQITVERFDELTQLGGWEVIKAAGHLLLIVLSGDEGNAGAVADAQKPKTTTASPSDDTSKSSSE